MTVMSNQAPLAYIFDEQDEETQCALMAKDYSAKH